jgi:hypothetical protein
MRCLLKTLGARYEKLSGDWILGGTAGGDLHGHTEFFVWSLAMVLLDQLIDEVMEEPASASEGIETRTVGNISSSEEFERVVKKLKEEANGPTENLPATMPSKRGDLN